MVIIEQDIKMKWINEEPKHDKKRVVKVFFIIIA